MRSKFLACAGLAVLGLCADLTTFARAADSKSKAPAAKKKTSELGDAVSKQLQWEDKVMGPDDKRAELDKIARAQAMQKAAAEKAERDKAERDKQAERQAAREAAQPKPKKDMKAEIAVPSVPEEKPKAVEAVAPPPPPSKPADDKFIDKLLKDDSGSKKRASKSSSADDKELEQLLAGTKETPAAKGKGKGKKGDIVDNLLESADKEPAMPAPKTKPTVPEWAKPEIASTPAPAPVIARPQPKKDDGVIHVVQGAAGSSAPVRPAPVAARITSTPPSTRKQGAAKPASWNDPFADAGSKKTMAARDPFSDGATTASTRRASVSVPAPRKQTARAAASAASWNDPFADAPSDRKAGKRAPASSPAASSPKAREVKGEPARHPAGWKDPFTEAPAPAAHAPVAMREPAKGESSKWEIAGRRGAHASASSEGHGSRWGIIKKRAH